MSVCFAAEYPLIKFSFEDEGGVYHLSVYLKENDLKEMKYHIAGNSAGGCAGCSSSMIAVRVTPTADNGLSKFSAFYEQEESDEANEKGYQYITVELQDTERFRVRILSLLRVSSF